ncbi:MAG: thiamine pyrophosphate-binding protein [Rhizobiaceae bacterium]|nr:thiamine pyrophosphate-binding protein [Rhizobiaceae bacterium]
MPTAAQYLVDFLRRRGVDRAYCVPGESYLPILDAFLDSPIDLITCYHESSAGFMAVADGRITGIPGICFVSRGPGATNATIALHTAQQDAVPMILFIGQVERRNLRRESFQEIDYGKMYSTICKWVAEVTDPARLPEVLARAMHVATDGTPGPVVVVLPEDMLDEPMDPPSEKPHAATRTAPAPQAVDAVLDLLGKAKRPLIIAGGQVAAGDGRAALKTFAEKWSIPVVVSFRRHDLFSNSSPLYAGDLGVSNTPAQVESFRSSDLVLAIGTRLGDLTTKGYTFPASPWPEQTLVHVCDDPAAIGINYQPDIGLACTALSFLEAVNAGRAPAVAPDRSGWTGELAAHRDAIAAWRPRTSDDGIVFGNVVARLQEHMPADGIIATDAGMSAALMYRHFRYEPPQLLLATVTGCMGFGVPGAIAMALRYPDRKVVALLGDGGFLMTSNELAIAVARKVPVTFLLANNRSLGSIRAFQERVYPGRNSATDLSPPDFDLFARSHGCAYMRVEQEAEVDAALQRAVAHDGGPLLVEFRTSLSAALPEGAREKGQPS